MLTICEFCGRECERPCRDLADMAIKQQRGEERCRRALLDKIDAFVVLILTLLFGAIK